MLDFKFDTLSEASRSGSRAHEFGSWQHKRTFAVPEDLFVASLSPDRRCLAGLQAITDENGSHLQDFSSLVHMDRADDTLHTVIERFEQGRFDPDWVPCQRLPEHRAYLLPDAHDRVYFCDCHRHCILRIVEIRQPLPPGSLTFFENPWPWFAFTEDGRAAVMRGRDRADVHILSWRSQPESAVVM